MVFNDTSTNQGLIQDCEFWVFGGDYGAISGNTTYLQEFTRLLNEGLNKATSKIMMSDANWQYDDPNHSDYPIGLTALVSGQQDYTLQFSATESHMKIDRVEVLTSDGRWKKLLPFDLVETDQAQIEYLKSDAEPIYYDKLANSVFLYPAPNYSQANGLKVFYQREPSYFATDDTTKVPGIPAVYHRLISLYACEDFAISKNQPEKKKQIEEQRVAMETDMQQLFNSRDKEDIPRLVPSKENNR